MNMEYHEYANIYRMIPEKELHALADDIKAKGQILPITLYEGKILDGRNRYRACQIANAEPITVVYDGNDPLGLIASLNDHRRHDSEGERALVGARMANLKLGDNQHKKEGRTTDQPSKTEVPITLERAAELAGTSVKSIQRAKTIVNEGIQELQDMVEGGEIPIRTASEVAKLDVEKQKQAVKGGVAGVKAAARAAKGETTASKPAKRKSSIPTTEEIAQDNQRILGNLKTAWVAANQSIRQQFLEWIEATKNNITNR